MASLFVESCPVPINLHLNITSSILAIMASRYVLQSQAVDRFSFVQYYFVEKANITALLLCGWATQLPLMIIASRTCSTGVPRVILMADWMLVLLEVLSTLLALVGIAAYLRKNCKYNREQRQYPFKLTERNLRLASELCHRLKIRANCEQAFFDLMGPYSSINQRLIGIEIEVYLRKHSWTTSPSFHTTHFTAENRACASCDTPVLARQLVCVTACCKRLHHVKCMTVCLECSVYCPLCKAPLRSSLIASIKSSLAREKPFDPAAYVK